MSPNTLHLADPRTLSLTLALAATPAMASVTFFDGTFNDADWGLTTINNANGAASTVQGSQVATGGNGGSYRWIRNTMAVSGSFAVVTGIHMSNQSYYDPSTQGGFASINYSEDSKNFLPLMGTGLAILQGGNFYVLRNPGRLYTLYDWGTNVRNGIVASDMHRIDANGNFHASDNPNFSASGSQMQFGFWRGNGSGGTASGTYTYETGIDNWSVSLVVPSPGALALVGMAAVLVRRRRN